MKKAIVMMIVVALAAMCAVSVFAAPKERYYDQTGNKYWCNTDSDGCWVTGENGEKDYIMFWSEAARAKYMGEGSNAPIGTVYNSSEMPLQAPPAAASSGKAPAKKATCIELVTEACEHVFGNLNSDTCICQTERDNTDGVGETYFKNICEYVYDGTMKDNPDGPFICDLTKKN